MEQDVGLGDITANHIPVYFSWMAICESSIIQVVKILNDLPMKYSSNTYVLALNIIQMKIKRPCLHIKYRMFLLGVLNLAHHVRKNPAKLNVRKTFLFIDISLEYMPNLLALQITKSNKYDFLCNVIYRCVVWFFLSVYVCILSICKCLMLGLYRGIKCVVNSLEFLCLPID